MTEPVGRYEPRRLTGDEALSEGATLRDFWRWIGSDLVGNTTRGLFAEYLVGLAVGAFTGSEADGVREEWGAYDLLTPEEVKVEVKSAAYLQTWKQTKENTPRFGIAQTTAWDNTTGKESVEKARWSHVYVFCLLHHRNKTTLDPLDVGQWTFFVLPTKVLDARVGAQRSLGLRKLRELGATETSFNGLRGAVRQAAPSRR